MAKQMQVSFASPQEMMQAKEYLRVNGIDKAAVPEDTLLHLTIPEEDWVSAHQLVTSLGGEIKEEGAFQTDFHEEYAIGGLESEENPNTEQETEIQLVDENQYMDNNLGYGDFEFIEPYVLHNYLRMENNEGDKK